MESPMKSPKRQLGASWRRKSLGGLASAPGSPKPELPTNNDRIEKAIRRKSHAAEVARRSLMASPYQSPKKSKRASPAAPPPTVEAAISGAELTDLYASCIKMCTENKINAKNSWSLNLIDYISDVLDTRHGEMTNFQVASCTLDASVKIYSCRVDSIHQDTFKVLGGLSRSGGSKDGEGEEGEGHEGAAKKRSQRSVNTIEANPANLNVKKFDLEFDVDPLFHKTSAAFDEGGARGLLLNHLAVRSNGVLAFDSSDKCDTVSTEGEADSTFNTAELQALMVADATTREVCPSLSSFLFMGWTPAEITGEEAAKETESALPTLDINMDTAGASPMYDSDFEDIGGGGLFGDGEEMGGDFGVSSNAAFGSARTAPVGSGASGEIVFALGGDGDEYSYFDQNHLRNWAGPSHWRFRAPKENLGKTEAPKKKKDKFFVDFYTESPDWKAAFSKGRAATSLAKSTLEKKEDNLLPDDVNYKLADLTRLFSKPAWRAQVSVKGTADADQEGTWYNYDNPNDANNYCAPGEGEGGDGMSEDEIGGDDYSPFNMADDTMIGPGFTPTDAVDGIALLTEPTKVQKIEINYAKNAKRVNVKQLKANIWEELTTEDKENAPEPTAPPTPGKQVFTEVTQQHSFADIVGDVPTKVSQKTAENLSVPIMFVALLHLANEKHLKITSQEDMSDLMVIQG